MDADARGAADVAIVGGGPAGAATGLCLARSGFRVRMFERSRYEDLRVGEALAPAARRLLGRLGALQSISGPGALRRHGVSSIWGRPEVRFHDFMAADGAGCHVDRQAFDGGLAALASDRGVEVHLASTVRSCRAETDGWTLTVAREGVFLTCAAAFLVVATGRTRLPGCFAQRQSFRDDRLVAIVRHLDAAGSKASRTRTWVEATPNGWWYVAPIPDHRMVTAYFTDADLLCRSGPDPEARWISFLRSAPETEAVVSGQRPLSPPKLVSAGSCYRWPVIGGRCLAIGDAAMAFDPLSGQGIYRALETGVEAARAIASVLEGNDHDLEDYAAHVRHTYRAYLRHRHEIYGLEQRWPSAPFWARRHRAPG